MMNTSRMDSSWPADTSWMKGTTIPDEATADATIADTIETDAVWWKSAEPFHYEGTGVRNRVCVMLIHGFTGNPGDCLRIGRYLNQAGYAVHAIRLPGHGSTPEEMSATRWEDWWRHTLACYDAIVSTEGIPDAAVPPRLNAADCIAAHGGSASRSSYAAAPRIVIPAGFSMGGLLALKLSLVRPVPAVVSLAAPVFLRDRRAWLAGLARYVKPYVHKPPLIPEYMAMERCAYARMPLACVASLYKHIRLMKRQLKDVRVPLFIGQGTADRTVRPESASYIYEAVSSPIKVLRFYPGMSHAVLADAGRDQVFWDVLRFVGEVTEKICGLSVEERAEVLGYGREAGVGPDAGYASDNGCVSGV